MRINKFLAHNTQLSRRAAETAIEQDRVTINSEIALITSQVSDGDVVRLDNKIILEASETKSIVVLLNKPLGYICSKDGQGRQTVYDLLPTEFRHLNIAGRLDKDSTGLVALTNDGSILQSLTHPSQNKQKIYQITLDRPLSGADTKQISVIGVDIGDERPSTFMLEKNMDQPHRNSYKATLKEGRNRQIRRTFKALGYEVVDLHRTRLGEFSLKGIREGEHSIIDQ